MAKISLNEKQRAFISVRVSGVTATGIPMQRAINRLFDALALDDLPRDTMERVNHPMLPWKEGEVEYKLTSDLRDYLIEWLAPTDRFPLVAFVSRILLPVYDKLKESRDGKAELASVPAEESEEVA